MIHTTFALAKESEACETSYKKFAEHVGGVRKYGKDTPIPLTEILDVLGIDDALWCLRCTIEDTEKESRLLACDYAEHVLHIYEQRHPNDKRPRIAIEVSRRYAQGEATRSELNAAGDARAAEREWQKGKFLEMLGNKGAA